MGAAALVVSAQQVAITKTTPLLQDGHEAAFYPTLNHTGDKLLYSDADAHGLKLLDLETNKVTTISNQNGAGYAPKWGEDGNVYFVTAQVNPENHLVYRSGLRFNLDSSTSQVLLEPQHGAVTIAAGTRGMAIKGEKRTFVSATHLGTSVYTQGSEIVISTGDKERRYSPVESHAGYLWASLSPGGDKVAFFAAGRGIVVIDLEGHIKAELGNYEMPCWYDNNYIVAQNASDDGYQFTSSQILLLKADGTFKHELTAKTSMTMQPTCGGGKIVFTTIDGHLTMLTLQITD